MENRLYTHVHRVTGKTRMLHGSPRVYSSTRMAIRFLPDGYKVQTFVPISEVQLDDTGHYTEK